MSGLGGKRPIQLPQRRISRCERVPLESGHTFFLHCGFDVDGTVREIFVNSRKVTSELAKMLADQAIGISYRLQYGPRLADLEIRSDAMRVIIDRAIEIERTCAAEVIAEYAAAGLVAA